MNRSDAVVVGGGVVGAAITWFLAREGLSVTLLERDGVASHASGAAAGMLRPFGESAGIGPFLHWARRSVALFPELASELKERTGIDPEFAPTGVFQVAADDAEADVLREKARAFASDEVEWLDAQAVRAEHHVTPEARGAFWSPLEANIRSPLLARACVAAAAELGATVETGTSATGLLREGDRVVGVDTASGRHGAGTVILCMGAWTPTFASWLGRDFHLPIEPVRGQILSLEAPLPSLSSTLVGCGVYLVPRRDGSLVVGATEERAGFDCRVTAAGLQQLLAAAPRLVPALANASFRSAWAGLRPATPDRLPAIGPVPGAPGLLLAAGHFRNGVLLAPITARLIADAVLGKGFPGEAAPFRPERFLA